MSAPDLSVVVLSWNTKDLTLKCLSSLASDRSEFSREVVVVDNGSEDGSPDAIAALDGVRLVRNDTNAGYAAGNNQGVEFAEGRHVCLLNSDTEVRPGALDLVLRFLLDHGDYGAAAPRLVNLDGSVQRACMRFPGLVTALCYDSFFNKFPPGSWIEDRYFMREFDHLHSRDVPQPPGACFMMSRAEYTEMGGLDPELFLFFNDVDLCRRLWKKGRRIRYVAEAEVVHHGGASTKGYTRFIVEWFRNRIAYYRKHYGPLSVPYLRLLVHLRAFEESVRAKRRHDDPADARAECAYIRDCVKEILAP